MSTLKKKTRSNIPRKIWRKKINNQVKKLEESKRKRKKQRKESIEHQELFGKGIEKMILIHDEMKTTLKKWERRLRKIKRFLRITKAK